MIFSDVFKENDGEPTTDVEMLIDPDPSTPEGELAMANQVEAIMRTAAMEEAAFFPGGDEAVGSYKMFLNEKVMTEGIISSAAKNNNIVRLNTRDDLKRRTNLAAMMLAKASHDQLWVKASRHKLQYRHYKSMIQKKYWRKAFKIARMSQMKHAEDMKGAAVPKFEKDRTGNRTSMSAVFGH